MSNFWYITGIDTATCKNKVLILILSLVMVMILTQVMLLVVLVVFLQIIFWHFAFIEQPLGHWTCQCCLGIGFGIGTGIGINITTGAIIASGVAQQNAGCTSLMLHVIIGMVLIFVVIVLVVMELVIALPVPSQCPYFALIS